MEEQHQINGYRYGTSLFTLVGYYLLLRCRSFRDHIGRNLYSDENLQQEPDWRGSEGVLRNCETASYIFNRLMIDSTPSTAFGPWVRFGEPNISPDSKILERWYVRHSELRLQVHTRFLRRY